jgi:hypothetical protein
MSTITTITTTLTSTNLHLGVDQLLILRVHQLACRGSKANSVNGVTNV